MAGPNAPLAPRPTLILQDHPVFLRAVDGGHVRGEVAATGSIPGQPARKSISSLRLEPFAVEVGLELGRPLFDWIQASLRLSAKRMDGSVAAVDASFRVQGYRHFRRAWITEMTIPAMDAADDQPGYFGISFQPEQIEYAKGDGASVKPQLKPKRKAWITSGFRLRLGNLPCGRVSKIDSFTIKAGVQEAPVGPGVKPKMAGRIEFPNLKVTFSAVDLLPWEQWFKEFVIEGKNGPERELQGAIELFDPGFKEILGSIELSQVGIFALREEKFRAGEDAFLRYIAELYVEKMAISIPNP